MSAAGAARPVPDLVVALVVAVATSLAAHGALAASPARGTTTPRAAMPATPRRAAVAAAADTARPSFTGRWKLDVGRSTFGNVPGQPKARTDVIEQSGGEIVQVLYLVLPTGPDTTRYRYRLDGTPTVNRVGAQDITARVVWEPGALHLVSKTKLMMLDMSLDERWRLAAGGDSLVMSRTVKYPLGEAQQSLRFGRE